MFYITSLLSCLHSLCDACAIKHKTCPLCVMSTSNAIPNHVLHAEFVSQAPQITCSRGKRCNSKKNATLTCQHCKRNVCVDCQQWHVDICDEEDSVLVSIEETSSHSAQYQLTESFVNSLDRCKAMYPKLQSLCGQIMHAHEKMNKVNLLRP